VVPAQVEKNPRRRNGAAGTMTPLHSLIILAAAAGALAGCKAGPDYVRPPVDVPVSYKETTVEWKSARPSDDAPRGRWWEIFEDAQLNALAEQVDISNQTIRSAEARFRQAQAAVAGARAGLFPTLDADASIIRNQSPGGSLGGTTAGRILTSRSASLAANWEVDLWGRVRRGIESSAASAQASASDIESARLSAQAELVTDYFQLRVLDDHKRLLEETVAAYGKSLELTTNRYRVGVAGKVEVAQAETQLKSTEAQLIDLGVQRSQLEHAIALLIGKAPADFSLPPAPFQPVMPIIPPGIPSELLERRSDIAGAERRVAAANAQIGVAQSAFFPALTLSGTLGSRASEASLWFTAASRFWSIGPAIALSLFDAGLRRSQTDQAIAAYDATVADYRQTVLSSFREVEDNLAALRILEQEAAMVDDAVRAARESTVLTINQYKAGTVSFLNVAVVQAAQLNNERTAAVVLGQRLTASVALIRALGGGWNAAELPSTQNLERYRGQR
jgi:NodT family efflux transporter outer membrane factor (OMF) lipoprotein